jgi:hypothetical protein
MQAHLSKIFLLGLIVLSVISTTGQTSEIVNDESKEDSEIVDEEEYQPIFSDLFIGDNQQEIEFYSKMLDECRELFGINIPEVTTFKDFIRVYFDNTVEEITRYENPTSLEAEMEAEYDSKFETLKEQSKNSEKIRTILQEGIFNNKSAQKFFHLLMKASAKSYLLQNNDGESKLGLPDFNGVSNFLIKKINTIRNLFPKASGDIIEEELKIFNKNVKEFSESEKIKRWIELLYQFFDRKLVLQNEAWHWIEYVDEEGEKPNLIETSNKIWEILSFVKKIFGNDNKELHDLYNSLLQKFIYYEQLNCRAQENSEDPFKIDKEMSALNYGYIKKIGRTMVDDFGIVDEPFHSINVLYLVCYTAFSTEGMALLFDSDFLKIGDEKMDKPNDVLLIYDLVVHSKTEKSEEMLQRTTPNNGEEEEEEKETVKHLLSKEEVLFIVDNCDGILAFDPSGFEDYGRSRGIFQLDSYPMADNLEFYSHFYRIIRKVFTDIWETPDREYWGLEIDKRINKLFTESNDAWMQKNYFMVKFLNLVVFNGKKESETQFLEFIEDSVNETEKTIDSENKIKIWISRVWRNKLNDEGVQKVKEYKAFIESNPSLNALIHPFNGQTLKTTHFNILSKEQDVIIEKYSHEIKDFGGYGRTPLNIVKNGSSDLELDTNNSENGSNDMDDNSEESPKEIKSDLRNSNQSIPVAPSEENINFVSIKDPQGDDVNEQNELAGDSEVNLDEEEPLIHEKNDSDDKKVEEDSFTNDKKLNLKNRKDLKSNHNGEDVSSEIKEEGPINNVDESEGEIPEVLNNMKSTFEQPHDLGQLFEHEVVDTGIEASEIIEPETNNNKIDKKEKLNIVNVINGKLDETVIDLLKNADINEIIKQGGIVFEGEKIDITYVQIVPKESDCMEAIKTAVSAV